MKDNTHITVKDALRRGNWYVKYPSFLILIGLILVPLLFFDEDEDGPLVYLIFLLSAFIISILYAQIAKPKWRIWAYKNVRNLHLLEKRAIEDDIIYAPHSLWTKYEISTKADKAILKQLRTKFDKEDYYQDTHAVPTETLLKKDTRMDYVYLIFWIVAFFASLYLVIFTVGFGLGIIIGICSIYFGYSQLKKIRYNRSKNNNVFLRINDTGIETEFFSIVDWDCIEDIDLHGAYSGAKYPFISLLYETEDKNFDYVVIEVDKFPINIKILEERLRIYKQRHLTSQTRNITL